MIQKQFFKKKMWEVLFRIPYFGASFRRWNRANNYKKENFQLRTECVFNNIYSENFWNSYESHSGPGSHIFSTRKIRKKLPILWKKYNIESVLDIPCGDYNWMKEVNKTGVDYIGGDIVVAIVENNNKNYSTENVRFEVLDITKDKLPKVDMIFCKDCLQHLSYENIKRALVNIKKSGAKYLFTTSYPRTWKNWDILDGDYRALNLRKPPFNFPKPLFKMCEYSSNGLIEPDKCMLLYEVNQIKI